MYEPKKLDINIIPYYMHPERKGKQSWQLVIPSKPILTREDAKQHKLHLQIAWEIFTLLNEKIDALDEELIVKNIPIGIMDIVEKLREL